MEWKVKMSMKAELEFKAQLTSNQFTQEDLKVISMWVEAMETLGPEKVALSKPWNDHELYGEWKGFRASCFSGPGRIIYKVIGKEVYVEVHKITRIHDYKKD